MLTITDPYDGSTIAQRDFAHSETIESALNNAKDAFAVWKNSSTYERSLLLQKIADLLDAKKEAFLETMRREAGKPIRFAEIEFGRAVNIFRWAAAETMRFSGELLRIDTETHGRSGFGIHTRFPRGIVLGITPYNWPLMLVAHKVAPAIACGCPIIIKPSPFTPLTAELLQSLIQEAGAPEGLMQVILADDEAAAKLTQHPDIAVVSFTGSSPIGKKVRRQADGKPVVLELGGNAWTAIFPDVSVDEFPAIAKRIALSGFSYAGQSCISVQNVAICHPEKARFIALLKEETRQTVYGNTSNKDVISGPVINEKAVTRLRQTIATAREAGEITCSENRIGNENPLLIPPTLIVMPDLPRSESWIQEEIFGPVINVMGFTEVETFIAQINNSAYGLQAGIFTDHWPTIDKLYRELQVGGVIVNDVPTTRYDHQPYGGMKESGQGREGVRYAMEDFTESKFLALSSDYSYRKR